MDNASFFLLFFVLKLWNTFNFETQRDGWLNLEGRVAKLLARLLITASTPGSNPYCPLKS